jgi:hypothetical protein
LLIDGFEQRRDRRLPIHGRFVLLAQLTAALEQLPLDIIAIEGREPGLVAMLDQLFDVVLVVIGAIQQLLGSEAILPVVVDDNAHRSECVGGERAKVILDRQKRVPGVVETCVAGVL